jgi:N12 class adenine-specific DNA methylase
MLLERLLKARKLMDARPGEIVEAIYKDVRDSFELAMRDSFFSESTIKDILTTVDDAITNHMEILESHVTADYPMDVKQVEGLPDHLEYGGS